MTHPTRTAVWYSGLAVAVFGLTMATVPSARAQGAATEVVVTGSQFAFAPSRIEVQRDDVVKITFTAGDIPHSLTIDAYRIAKRAGAGQTVVFEFRADQTGTFDFYCNLTQDSRCREMKGQLVVK